MKKKYYENQFKKINSQLEQLQTRFNRLSRWRGLTILMALASLGMGIYTEGNLGYFLALPLLVVFFLLMKQHAKTKAKLHYNQSQKLILEQYLARFSDHWHTFQEDGHRFLSASFPQAKDLDLLGRNSLYQYICAANTVYGKERLAKHLLNPAPKKVDVLKHQQAVMELADQKKFSLKIQTLSNLIATDKRQKNQVSVDKFIKQAESPQQNVSQLMRLLMWGLPSITLIFIIFSLAGIMVAQSIVLSIIGIIAQLLITGFGYGKNTAVLNPLLSFYRNLEVYKTIFAEMEQKNFDSAYLQELQAIIKKNKGAVKSLEQLNTIGEAVKVRYSGIVYLILSGLLMWDYQCINLLNRWKQANGKDIRKWLEAIGELESLLSLAVLCNTKEHYCFPLISKGDTPAIKFANLQHPLINEQEVVGNSLQIRAETCIITGSNMSGKTTLMRSIGTNLVLAYAGAPVLASSFETSLMTIFTSMRIEDNVSEGISTFYAELLRIKEMVDYSKQTLPMIALVDEIFKGTNSADRIIGATETIKKLSQPWIITIVTTHDFELCNLVKDPHIKATNYHFSERYIDDEICFDYKIKTGRCKTTNAQYLLRMAGVL